MSFKGEASSSSKRTSKDVDGYVHKVSQIRHPVSGNRYFEFQVQRMDGDNRVVCFSPTKRDELLVKQQKKEPVTLMNLSPQKRKYQPDETEFRMNYYSHVVTKKNLSFPWRDITGKFANATIRVVNEMSATGNIVTVTAKVMWKSELEVVFSTRMNKNLNKCDVVVADTTGAITVTLFEEAIDKVAVTECYVFGDFKVANYRKKCLNSTPCSTIVPHSGSIELAPEIEQAANEITPKENTLEVIEGGIVAVDAKKQYICVGCSNKIGGVQEESIIVKCPSCSMNLRKKDMKTTVNVSIIIQENREDSSNVIGRFTPTIAALNKMVESLSAAENYKINAMSILELSEETIVESLLLVENILFKLNKETKVVEEMSVKNYWKLD